MEQNPYEAPKEAARPWRWSLAPSFMRMGGVLLGLGLVAFYFAATYRIEGRTPFWLVLAVFVSLAVIAVGTLMLLIGGLVSAIRRLISGPTRFDP